MDTFSPGVLPTVSSSVQFSAKTLEASFGDGYEQVAVAGLNSVSGVYTVNFENLTLAQRDAIETFFKAKAGAEAFFYTFPGESTARKFRCKSWSRAHIGALFNVRAEFREVFDIT